MGLLDGITPPEPIRSCKVRTLLESLSDADQKILVEAMASESWTHMALASQLKNRGLDMTPETLRKHRQKRCSC